ncbi:MAG: hypothetical protein ACRCVV_08020 [Shewanella sp.]
MSVCVGTGFKDSLNLTGLDELDFAIWVGITAKAVSLLEQLGYNGPY